MNFTFVLISLQFKALHIAMAASPVGSHLETPDGALAYSLLLQHGGSIPPIDLNEASVNYSTRLCG